LPDDKRDDGEDASEARWSEANNEQEQISALLRPSKSRQRPDLSALDDAVSYDGRFLAQPGDSIIMELSTDRGFWLYTMQFIVEWVRDDGSVGLYNQFTQRQAGTNYKCIGPNLKIKLPATRNRQ
jgi:hypothetical protein